MDIGKTVVFESVRVCVCSKSVNIAMLLTVYPVHIHTVYGEDTNCVHSCYTDHVQRDDMLASCSRDFVQTCVDTTLTCAVAVQ